MQRIPNGRPVTLEPRKVLEVAQRQDRAQDRVRWQTEQAVAGSDRARGLLEEGWEPFAASGCLLHLRRQVP